MANVGYATMQVIPSLKGMTGEMNKQLSILGYKSSSAGQKAGQSFATQFTNLAARVIGAWAVGNAVNRVFDFMKDAFIGVNSEIENSTAALAQMLGSSGEAQKLVKQFQELASASATLDLKGASQLGRQLVAMGVPAKQAVGLLKSLANAAAGTGTGMDGATRAVRAFGQISAKGRVQTEELLQLQELGIPALRLLAQGFGVTQREMQDMVTKGAVPASKAIPILQKQLDKFYGQSDKVDTFSEAWDKLRTDMQGAIGRVTAGLFAKLSTAMQGLANSNFIDKLAAGASAGLSRLGELVGRLAGLNWSPIIGGFKDIGSAVGSLVSTGQSLWAIFGPLVLDAFKALGAAFVLGAKAVKELAGWLASASKWLVQYSGWIRPIAVGIAAVVGAMKAWAAIQAVITVATKAWAAAQLALNLVMAANPIAIVVLAVIGLAAAFTYAWKHSETFRKVVTTALNGIKAAGLIVAHFFTGPFLDFFKMIGSFFSGPFVHFFTGGWNKIQAGASKVFGWVKKNWPLLLGILTGPIGTAVVLIVKNWGKISAGFNTVKKKLKGAVDDIAGFFLALPRRISGIGHMIGDSIVAGVKSLWNSTLGGKGIHFMGHGFSIPKLARGGVVDRPTLALIGEAGPEAVVPLAGKNGRRAAKGMGLDGNGALVENLTINVGEDASVRDGLEETMWQLRRIARGGVHV